MVLMRVTFQGCNVALLTDGNVPNLALRYGRRSGWRLYGCAGSCHGVGGRIVYDIASDADAAVDEARGDEARRAAASSIISPTAVERLHADVITLSDLFNPYIAPTLLSRIHERRFNAADTFSEGLMLPTRSASRRPRRPWRCAMGTHCLQPVYGRRAPSSAAVTTTQNIDCRVRQRVACPYIYIYTTANSTVCEAHLTTPSSCGTPRTSLHRASGTRTLATRAARSPAAARSTSLEARSAGPPLRCRPATITWTPQPAYRRGVRRDTPACLAQDVTPACHEHFLFSQCQGRRHMRPTVTRFLGFSDCFLHFCFIIFSLSLSWLLYHLLSISPTPPPISRSLPCPLLPSPSLSYFHP
jgi:hypothetical protein